MTDIPIIFSAPMVRALLEGRKTQTRRLLNPTNCLLDGHGVGACGPMRELWDRLNFEDPENFVDLGPSPAGNPGPYLHVWTKDRDTRHRIYPCIQPGDRLWVRETTTYWERPDSPAGILHPRANESSRPQDGKRYERWVTRVGNEVVPGGEDFIVYKADDSKRSLGEWSYPHPIYEHCIGRFGKTITAIHMPRWASRLTLVVTATKIERLNAISPEDARAEGLEWVAPTYGISGLANSWSDDPRVSFRALWNSLHGPDTWDANPEVVALSFRVHKVNIDAMEKAA